MDDPAEDRFRLKRYLVFGGYRVLEASGSKEALVLIQDAETAIDLVIADLRMPRLNGFELAQRLQSIHPDLKTVFVSGYSREILTLLKMPIEKGLLIPKSLDRQAFLESIHRFLSPDPGCSTRPFPNSLSSP